MCQCMAENRVVPKSVDPNRLGWAEHSFMVRRAAAATATCRIPCSSSASWLQNPIRSADGIQRFKALGLPLPLKRPHETATPISPKSAKNAASSHRQAFSVGPPLVSIRLGRNANSARALSPFRKSDVAKRSSTCSIAYANCPAPPNASLSDVGS